jgi:hypothetical protein
MAHPKCDGRPDSGGDLDDRLSVTKQGQSVGILYTFAPDEPGPMGAWFITY